MKKRAKIITTIASLCLAVALMAFGVYAATTVSFSVASKVSFTVKDVFVDVTGKIEFRDNVSNKFVKTWTDAETQTKTAAGDWAVVGGTFNEGAVANGTLGYWEAVTLSGETWASEASATSFAAQSYSGTIGSGATPLAALTDELWNAGTAKLDSDVNGVRYTITIVNRSLTNDIYVNASDVAEIIYEAGTTPSYTYLVETKNNVKVEAGTMQLNGSDEAEFLPEDKGEHYSEAGAYVKLGKDGGILTLTYQIVYNDLTTANDATAFLDGIEFTITNDAPASISGYTEI